MEKRDYFLELRIQELICRREGMISENKQREICGKSMAYTEEAFWQLEQEFHSLEARV